MADNFDEFIARTRALNGQPIDERPQWNKVATADAIRHFAYGIGDDNPLWVDPAYASQSSFGRLVAPPSFVFSVLYPALHGAVTDLALTYLISGVRCEWYLPVLEGDELTAEARQVDVVDARDRAGRRTAFIEAETRYWNQSNAVVAVVRGTLACIDRRPQEMLLERTVHQYSEQEIRDIDAAIRAEIRTGGRPLEAFALEPGQALPPIVRGPLTVGDLVCWHSAIGPPYRAGVLGYRDCLEKPHFATTIPGMGWPVRYSQQHEDPRLAAQRGMPAPFDNSFMRTAWLSTLLTNWLGDEGRVCALNVDTSAPVIYGDAVWYHGHVVQRVQSEQAIELSVRITGTNQLGEITTSGEAELRLPTVDATPRAAGLGGGSSLRAKTSPPPTPARPDREALPCVHRVFESHCRSEAGSGSALWFGETRWPYAELNRVANIAAFRLRDLGVGGGSVCGICLERAPEFVTSVLAVLKTGAAYLPLDRALPAARLKTMLAASQADYLIIAESDRPLYASFSGRVVAREELEAQADEPDPGDLAVAPEPDHTAYLLFTSGSRGEPKAVRVPHGSLSVYLRSLLRPLDVHRDDVFLHTASFSFSASVRQLMLPLYLGASWVLADSQSVRDSLALLRLVNASGVTIWDTVPSSLQQMIDTLKALPQRTRETLLANGIRGIFTTGEALRWETVGQWRDGLAHDATLYNLYSQTETAGTVCVHRLPDGAWPKSGVVPLGHPVDNTRVFLLDSTLKPVETGEVGEIFVGGERLANGYDGDPELTAAAFLAPPNDLETQGRLYRTGDLGRLRGDGVLESLGRADDQVQIRGARVRLREVGEVISQHPNVGDCMVRAYQDEANPAEPLLVAYFVARRDPPPGIGELRRFIVRILPEHMVPARFMALAAFPLNPNGKIDSRRLPTPELQRDNLDGQYVAPADELELALAGLWQELLHVTSIGTRDDFFELGGHSLVASRLRARVMDLLGVDLPLEDFFDYPTIAGQAQRIANAWPAE